MSGSVVGVCGEVGPAMNIRLVRVQDFAHQTCVVLLCWLRPAHQTKVLVLVPTRGRVKPEPGELLLQRGLLRRGEVGEGGGGCA